MISLTWKIVTNPDLDGWNFYVKEGDLFDADDYSEAFGLNRPDINYADIHAVQDAAGHLNPGEWLQVTHTIDEE